MTTAVATRLPQYRVTFGHDLRAEWIKIRTLRSTWLTLGATLAMMVGIGFLGALITRFDAINQPGVYTKDDGIQTIIFSFVLAQMSIAVLGSLTMTGEYATGMIRSTFAAEPRRLPAVWAKTLVITAITAVVGVIGIGLSYLVSIPLLSKVDLVADITDPTVLKVMGAYAFYLVLVAIMSVGVGTIVRHSAGAIFTLVAILFILFMISQFFSNQTVQDIARFLPMSLGMTMMSPNELGPDSLTQVEATLAMVGWAVVAQGIAAVMLVKRDA